MLEQLLYGSTEIDEIEVKIMTLELYVTIREYLLVDKILDALDKDLNEKTRYVLEYLRHSLLDNIRYYLYKNGLEEASMIDLALLSWKNSKRLSSKTKIAPVNKE